MEHSNSKALRRLVSSCIPTTVAPISPSSLTRQFAVQTYSVGGQMESSSHSSLFGGVQQAPADPILGISLAYKADPVSDKLDLGVGAYRDEERLPWVLPVVRKVEAKIAQEARFDKEYLPIEGLADFNTASVKLLYGADSPAISEKRIVKCQSISGTGALRLGAEFIHRFLPAGTPIYISNPTWGNHPAIFKDAGCADVRSYRYYKPETRGLDFEGMCADLRAAPKGSVLVLHTCAHNPTGVDPTTEQWNGILDIIQEKEHIPFFDTAYQGFATGDLEKDATPVRLAVARGFELFAAQSYSKNFGLYGERAGCFSMVVKTPDVVERILSQVKVIVRPMYSNPPTWGARIVATILNNQELYNEWVEELRVMSSRIQRMRQELFDGLKQKGTPGDWEHILKQIGMFSFTGLTKNQVELMTKKHHIYMLSNGRISMAGLTSKTVPKLVDAIHEAVTTVQN
eukprot:TRINITY_DN1369_c0_g1_i1.p1 TRINITY_DN1369_c0_g1~~TRINITY_DN1369_c0_g1_i1.p1  ORF type:complete len:476 (+),score=76.56 TRINITY_DN1369_c0_g1_i1:59-1429(+)